MHGLINRAIQCFVRDTYGNEVWLEVTRKAGLEFSSFEPMLIYDDLLTDNVVAAIGKTLMKPREEVLEDLGTYLVSHPNVEALRRLLRFGGVNFVEFLHSLDELPERARLAVSDLDLPMMRLEEFSPGRFSLTCHDGPPGFGHAMMGILRAMADDYGALVYLEHRSQQAAAAGGIDGSSEGSSDGGGDSEDVIDITLIETAFAEGRDFDLGARAG